MKKNNKHQKQFTIRNILFTCVIYILSICFTPTSTVGQNKSPKDSTKTNSIPKYLKDRAETNYLYKKLYEWLVISNDSNLKKNVYLSNWLEQNKKYDHKIIRSIKIKQISPFSKMIIDTIGISMSPLEKSISKIRFETRKSVILNHLTFKKGEFSNADKLKDSERLLRSQDYITDALIFIQPAVYDSSMVDVIVFVQDNYPYGATLSVNNNITAGIYSKNVLGYGIQLEHMLYRSSNTKYGLSEKLIWNNIYGTYITLSANYSNMYNQHYYKIGTQKRFYTREVKHAGGFNLTQNYHIPNYGNDSINLIERNFDYTFQDYWLGKSYLIRTDNFFDHSNITLYGQIILSEYYNLPDDLLQKPYYLPNIYTFGSISFSKRDYYKNKLIYNFGRTEDVPYGFLASLTYGFNHNQWVNRNYLGAHFSYGKAIIPNKGYFYWSSDFQSFLNKTSAEDTRIKLQVKYISSLMNVGIHRWRSFLSGQYLSGFNNTNPQYIYLNEANNGISALRSKALRGTKKMVLSAESIFFSSKEILGFSMAFYSFYDMGWISGNTKLFKTKTYSSLGAGIRLRNNHLVFNTIQIQLAYFPNIPPGGTEYDFRLTSEQVDRFNLFMPRKPYTDIYQ